MGLKSGYKQTEVGIIPEVWRAEHLDQCVRSDAPICYGILMPGEHCDHGVPVVKVRDILDGRINESNLLLTHPSIDEMYKRSRLRHGDLLITIRGTTGRVAIVTKELDSANITQDTARARISPNESNKFVYYALQSQPVQQQVALHTIGQAVKGINIRDVKSLVIPLPETLVEQHAIAEALSAVDTFVESLEQLVTKKRNLKRGAMHELLTGKRRLPGFNDEWKTKRIVEIASPSSEKNTDATRLPVLTCSKHHGFVDSLAYFKNQVFSNDTSTYKLIRRGQIGYPANHVEEGSIGLQDLYDVALVSPIYIVFSVSEEVDSHFLHRVLKLDSYRHKFKMATTSSVDRRGSLRWPAFSEITVSLPLLPEQNAIVAVLSDMDAEIATLNAKLAKARRLKQGMMHNLLTGSIRLV